MKYTTFKWSVIRDEIERPHGSPVCMLIEYVIDSGLSHYLHPATMHTNLRIGRSENFSRADGELTVEYENIGGRVIFNYYDSTSGESWLKECESNEVISTFKHIITRRLNWIKNES